MRTESLVRPMREGDVAEAERLTAQGFHELDLRTAPRGVSEPQPGSGPRSELWRRRMRHMLAHDPGGCWVAEDSAGLVGVAVALRRDTLWILAAFVVRPGSQGAGVGRELLDAASTHGRGCLRGMLAASSDPRAARRYHAAGFTLHPTMSLTGKVDRALLPVVERVREGTAGDIDLLDSVDRQTRGAAHGVDHQVLGSLYRLVVVDRTTGAGYAYVEPGGGPHLLAATNRRTAVDLAWESLASSTPDVACEVSHVTAENPWAVDVGMAARLELCTSGYLALRNMRPPAPYLPSGHFL